MAKSVCDQGLATSLDQLKRQFDGIPHHSHEKCDKSAYERAFCTAKQFRRFAERFVQPLRDGINQALCTNKDFSDLAGHHELCREAADLLDQIERKRAAAVDVMMVCAHDDTVQREILNLHIVAAGGRISNTIPVSVTSSTDVASVAPAVT